MALQRRIKLYVCNAPNNMLDKKKWLGKVTGEGRDLPTITIDDFIIKDECSVSNPHIIIKSFNRLFGYNYCYINDFERFYYIVDYITLPQGQVELVLKCDVLMSFREAIKNLVVHEERATNGQSSFLVDSDVAVQTNAKISKVYSLPFDELFANSGDVDYLFRIANSDKIVGSATATGKAIALYAQHQHDLYISYLAQKRNNLPSDWIEKYGREAIAHYAVDNGFAYSQYTDYSSWNGMGTVPGTGQYEKYPMPYKRYDTSNSGFVYKIDDNPQNDIHYDEKTYEVDGITYNSGLTVIDDTYIQNNASHMPTWPMFNINMVHTWTSFDCSSFAWRCCKFGYKIKPGTGAKCVDINSSVVPHDGTQCGNTGSQVCFLASHGCLLEDVKSPDDLLPGDLIYWGPANGIGGNHMVYKVIRAKQIIWIYDNDLLNTDEVLFKISVSHVQVVVGGGQAVGAESETEVLKDSYGTEKSFEGYALICRNIPDFEAYAYDYKTYEKDGTKKNYTHRALFFRPSLLVDL